ncbi:hypothetical protein WN48_04356 [Eufriesea mexicana]|nr:hypothetical protein WN48_04356 [Eufriesea mexicana]
MVFDQVYGQNDRPQRCGLFNGTYEKESVHPRIPSDGRYDGRLQAPVSCSLLIKRERMYNIKRGR